MTPTVALLILAWVAIVLLALALGGVVAQQRALHSLVRGRPAAAAPEPLIGELLSEDGDVIDPPYIALFVTPGCASCKQVLRAVAETLSSPEDRTVPVFIVSDHDYASDAVIGWDTVTWLVDREAAQRFGIPAFPWLVAVDADGNATAHQVAHNPDEVTEQIRKTSPTMSKKGTTA